MSSYMAPDPEVRIRVMTHHMDEMLTFAKTGFQTDFCLFAQETSMQLPVSPLKFITASSLIIESDAKLKGLASP